MDAINRLPDAEFEVMKAVWNNDPPVTTRMLMEQLGNRRGWKLPALITLLTRLAERGFLRSEKHGKERMYYPLIAREEYFQFETAVFFRKVHGNSLTSLMTSLTGGQALAQEERRELLAWLREKGEENE